MNKVFQKDLILVILIALIALACLSIKGTSKQLVVMIPYVILLFFLPGYAIIRAVAPKNMGSAAKIIMGIVISIIILSLLTFNADYSKVHIKPLLQTLAEITLFFAFIAYLRIFITSRQGKRIIICESCGGTYELEEGESLENFENCRCGGRLKYAESSSKPKPEASRQKKLFGGASKNPKTVPDNYIMCQNCGGYYRLKDDESLDDFGTCSCGGELKTAPKYFNPGK
jgi:hypothetical protein